MGYFYTYKGLFCANCYIIAKIFDNHEQYEAFTATTEFVMPNVSLCVLEDEVHYNPLIDVTGVTLDKHSISLLADETDTLVATVLPADTATITDNIAVFTARNFNEGDVIMVSGATASDTFTL